MSLVAVTSSFQILPSAGGEASVMAHDPSPHLRSVKVCVPIRLSTCHPPVLAVPSQSGPWGLAHNIVIAQVTGRGSFPPKENFRHEGGKIKEQWLLRRTGDGDRVTALS